MKFDFKENSPLEQVKKSSTPTLFIHGDRDSVVPFWMNSTVFFTSHGSAANRAFLV